MLKSNVFLGDIHMRKSGKWGLGLLIVLLLIILCWKLASMQRDKNAKACFDEGYAEYKLGDYEGAIADYTKAIELDPSLKDKLQPLIDEAKKHLH